MKDTKEIVLFFKGNPNFSSFEVAKEILNRYELLGEPVILPEASPETKVPTVIFNKNSDMQVEIGRQSVNVVISNGYFDKIASIIFDMVDLFEGFNADFYRIGYISSVFFPPKYLARAQERFFNMNNLEGMENVNFSWFHTIVGKNGKINCWERVITDSTRFDDLLMQYDFNSPVDEDFEFNMKYIKEFIKITNDYMEERLDF